MEQNMKVVGLKIEYHKTQLKRRIEDFLYYMTSVLYNLYESCTILRKIRL